MAAWCQNMILRMGVFRTTFVVLTVAFPIVFVAHAHAVQVTRMATPNEHLLMRFPSADVWSTQSSASYKGEQTQTFCFDHYAFLSETICLLAIARNVNGVSSCSRAEQWLRQVSMSDFWGYKPTWLDLKVKASFGTRAEQNTSSTRAAFQLLLGEFD